MGFNYLQTDDRDDYFARYEKKQKTNLTTGITLISPTGEKIFENEPSFKIRAYAKKAYLPFGKGAKKIWRQILLSNGYQVINVKSKTPQP